MQECGSQEVAPVEAAGMLASHGFIHFAACSAGVPLSYPASPCSLCVAERAEAVLCDLF
jgi:hypothetical protein